MQTEAAEGQEQKKWNERKELDVARSKSGRLAGRSGEEERRGQNSIIFEKRDSELKMTERLCCSSHVFDAR